MKKMILLLLINFIFVNVVFSNETETANKLLKSEIDSLIADLPNSLEVDKETSNLLKKLSFNKKEIGLFTYATFQNGILTISGKGYVSEQGASVLSSIKQFVYAVKLEEGTIALPSLSYMPSLMYVSLPSTIKKIDYGAFSNDVSLLKVNIPEGVAEIGAWSFSHCESLKKIIIPNSVMTIRNFAFIYCKQLTDINIPNTITLLQEGIFSYCSSLREINIPESVMEIKTEAFYNCDGMLKLYIPDTVTSIEEEAFEGMKSLKEIRLSENILEIPENAFKNCKSLTSIVIPASVETLGEDAFKGCDNLRSIELKTSRLKSIGKNCFENCKRLNTIIVYSKVAPKISKIFENEKSSIDYYQRITLYVTKQAKASFMNTVNWNKFSAIEEIAE